MVRGREKRPYSIFRKMQSKSIGFEQLSDIYGFRVIVGTVEACYRVLGVVHTTWPTVPGRFKDYMSTPKQNDYARSTRPSSDPPGNASSCRSAPRRWTGWPNMASRRMRSTRTASSAGATSPNSTRKAAPMNGCDGPSKCFSQGDTPEEFLENTKLELFHDQVFCFTPKGTPDRPAARRDADRLCLCGAYRHRQHLRRRQDQRPDHAAGDRAAKRRRGRHRPVARRKRRRRPGKTLRLRARRARRSGAPHANRRANNTGRSVGIFWNVRSFAPGIR
jgi:hypothetical protein